jgi:hypothetical protein
MAPPRGLTRSGSAAGDSGGLGWATVCCALAAHPLIGRGVTPGPLQHRGARGARGTPLPWGPRHSRPATGRYGSVKRLPQRSAWPRLWARNPAPEGEDMSLSLLRRVSSITGVTTAVSVTVSLSSASAATAPLMSASSQTPLPLPSLPGNANQGLLSGIPNLGSTGSLGPLGSDGLLGGANSDLPGGLAALDLTTTVPLGPGGPLGAVRPPAQRPSATQPKHPTSHEAPQPRRMTLADAPRRGRNQGPDHPLEPRVDAPRLDPVLVSCLQAKGRE